MPQVCNRAAREKFRDAQCPFVGSFPELEDVFPMRPAPIKQGPEDVPYASSSKTVPVGPVASGAGFFTPGWRPAPDPPQPFRMGLPLGGRDSMCGMIFCVSTRLRPSD